MFPDMPVLVQGGDEAYVLHQKHVNALPGKVSVFGIWVFHGLDRGDIVEMDTEVRTGNGFQIALRSDHKETMASFSSWTYYRVPYVDTSRLVTNLMLRVNGKQANAEHPRYGELTARGHFGLVVSYEEMLDDEDVDVDVSFSVDRHLV